MSAHEHSYQLETARWNTGRNVLFFAALVCIVGCVAGYLQNPERFFLFCEGGVGRHRH